MDAYLIMTEVTYINNIARKMGNGEGEGKMKHGKGETSTLIARCKSRKEIDERRNHLCSE